MSALPPEIITSVLSRLPVKSLLRFRCVSKPWCTEIDSPYFINLHLNVSIATKSKLLLFRSDKGHTLFSINLNSAIAEIEIPLSDSYQFHVWGSANCLLLLEAYFKGRLFLFNPSTRKYLAIPDSTVKNTKVRIKNCFLGYDAMHDDYKVCRLLRRTNQLIYEARVYSLKSNSWRTIKDLDNRIVNPKDQGCVFVNGALHSICKKKDPMKSRKTLGREIVAFDIETEASCLLPLPEFNDKDPFSINIDVHEGCLCVIKTIYKRMGDDVEEVWVMKEYGVKESWNMLLSVAFPLYSLADHFFYLKSSNEVLLRNNESMSLVWHDLQTGNRRNFLTCDASLCIPRQLKVCVESLVPVDQKKKQQQLRGKKRSRRR